MCLQVCLVIKLITMGNNYVSSTYAIAKCTIHKESNLEVVCIHARCIEPLCSQCVPKHQSLHTSIGAPPILRPYKELIGSLTETIRFQGEMYNKNSEFSESVRRLSTVDSIKELTRQYFMKRRSALSQKKEVTASDLIQNIEMSQKLSDVQTKQRIRQFFRHNLQANQAVIGEEFRSHY